MSQRLVLFILCSSYALGAGGMVATKFAYESFSYGQIVFSRVGIAAFFFLLMFPKWRRLPYRKGDWKYLGAVVLSEPCLTFIFMALAMKFTSASQGGVIYACFPICTAILGWALLGEKLTRRIMMGIAIAFVGVVGMSLAAGSADAHGSNPILGDILVLGAALATAGYTVSCRYVAHRYSPMAIAAIQAIGGSIAFLPLLILSPMPTVITLPSVLALLYMGICMGVIAYLCFNFALHYVEAGLAALIGNLMPVFTLIYAYALLGERLSMAQILFALVTLAGVLVATTKSRHGAQPVSSES